MSYFRNTPMAIDRARFDAELASFEPRLEAARQMSARGESTAERRQPDGQGRQGFALLGLSGVLTHAPTALSTFMGWQDLETFGKNFDQFANAPQIRSIILEIDSPGGSVYGVEETFTRIFKARSQKKIVAVVNPMACSAAYWIASAASEIAVTPSGELGSIGVFTVHTDASGAFEKAGVKHTLVKAGTHKAETLPIKPLSTSAKDHIQGRVDDLHERFLADVAKGRRVSVDTVRKSFGEGRSVAAREAVSLCMADRIATLEEVISELTGSSLTKATASASAVQDYWQRQAKS